MHIQKLSLYILLCGMTAVSHAATPNIDHGKQVVAKGAPGVVACVSCHGDHGQGEAHRGYPRLAGQNPDYLYKQIQSFKAGTRVNNVMGPIAKALSEQDARDALAYYSSLNTPGTPASNANPELIQLGEHLAQRGNWEKKNMPSCNACHGANGMGVPPHFPRLAGQNATYIMNQIQAWKNGTRKNDPQHLMQTIAKKLDANEIQAVAAYYASLNPAQTNKLMPAPASKSPAKK